LGRYTVLETDIMTADMEMILADSDVLVHLAAITDATTSFGNEGEVERINYEGTMKVAQACVKTGVSMVFPSTTSVYGTQSDIVDEDCSAEELKPQSPYAESKLMAEDYLSTLSTSGLKHVTCRFGTIFGVSPGMRFHTVVNKFCWQALTGKPLTVWRTAIDQKRPYLDLTDAVAAIAFIIDERLFDGDLYNIVTVNTSVRTVVNLIENHIPSLAVEYVDTKIMNQLSYEVLNLRFREKGFKYTGNLEQGISETIRLLGGLQRQRNVNPHCV